MVLFRPIGPSRTAHRARRSLRGLGGVFLVAAIGSVAVHARADDPDDATKLFEQGRRELQGGHAEVGCAHILESYRLSPAVGAQLNLAYCEELRGKRAHALRLYRSARTQIASTDPRSAKVNERIRSLEATLPRVVVRIAARAPLDTQVFADDEAITLGQLGKPYEVDPATTHTFVARAANGYSATESLSLMGGEQREITLTPMPPAPRPPVSADRPAPSVEPSQQSSTLPAYHSVGVLILGAVAVAAAVPAIAFTVDASNKNDQIAAAPRGVCAPTTTPACQAVQSDIDARVRDRTATWIFAGASGAALIGAGVWWLLAPGSTAATVTGRAPFAPTALSGVVPAFDLHGVSLSLMGIF